VQEQNLYRRGRFGPKIGRVAPGVWLLRGDIRGGMNVFFIEDEGGGVVQFDAATRSMRQAVADAGRKLGGINRVVLGHAHADHRGTASVSGAPIYCHPDAVAEARSPEPITPYFDFALLEVAPVRWIFPTLLRRWDGGPVQVADTVEPGDEVAGFEVVDLSGHAPGQIGLWRKADRLALVSDTIYLVDSARLKELPEGTASVPHPAFNMDTEQARAAIHRLAELNPATVCAGHGLPLTAPDLRPVLEQAAARFPGA
jgi:hydroxyacylglutathione hydrolase